MDQTQTVVIVIALTAFVLYRQMRLRPATGHGLGCFALALIVFGLASGGLVTSGRLALSVVLIVVELAFAIGFAVVRALTVRVWRDADGLLWARGTGWTMLGWLASMLTRVALYSVGRALGLESAPTALLVFVGVTIGVQWLLVARRARALPSAATASPQVPA